MLRIFTIFFIFILSLSISSSLQAETDLKVSGEVRVRAELDSRNFTDEEKTLEYTDMRTRVAVEAFVDSNAHVMVQFQDSRRFGDSTVFGGVSSGNLDNGRNVDIHQAFVKLDNSLYEGVGFKAGRFEVNFGNQRVFGAVGWSNVGRAWEGAVLSYETKCFTINALYLKKLELNASDGNRDFNVYSLYAHSKKLNADLFVIYDHDADVLYTIGKNNLDRISIGTYFKRQFDNFDIEGNGVYQFGNKAVNPNLYNFNEMDIAAFLVTFEAAYNFPDMHQLRLAAGIDYASGDDNLNDKDFKAYDNLYYTAHKFRGHMDYFTASGNAGLVDLYFKSEIEFLRGWNFRGDFHYFQTAEEYLYATDKLTSDVGLELDLSVATTRIAGIYLENGISLFFPKDAYAASSNPETGLWTFHQITVDF